MLVSVSIVLPPAAFAADEASVFEEVTVTAKKREQSIYEVPTAISAFTAATIEKQGIVDLTDIGKFVPNLNVTGFSAGHTSSVNPFIRGIGLQDHLITTDPGVSVYVDGVYLGRQVGQNWSLANVERVEVLRGPQGTLYGRNSIGGAINIITKKPGEEETSRIGLEVGTRGRVTTDLYSNIVVSDDVAVSLSGGFTRRDGVGKFLNIPDPEADVGELQDISARVAVRWQATENLSLLFTADGNQGDNGLRPYTTLIDELGAQCRDTDPNPEVNCERINGAVYNSGFRNSDVAPSPYDNNTGQVQQTGVNNKAYGYSLTAELAITEDVNAKLIYSERRSEYESGLDDDSFFENFLSFPEVGEADQTSLELQFNGDYGNWDFVSGLYFFTEEGLNDQRPTFFLSFPGTFTIGQEVDSFAVYGNIGFQVNDKLRIAGGLRYTEDEKAAFTDINDSLLTARANRDYDEVSFDASFSYDVADGLTLYGSIADGYQSGQFPARPFCLFGDPDCFVATENITATNFEIGIKGTPTRNIQVAATAFFTDYSDLPYQVSTTAGMGFDTNNIIVDQESTGFELESTVVLSAGLRLHATLGLIDVDVDEAMVGGNRVQAVAPLTPETTISLSPEYTHKTSNGGEWVFRADYSYRDEMFGEPSDDPGRFTLVNDREIINLDISYSPPGQRWTAGFYGRNVTDERYDNARLNTNDYVLIMLSNDLSEFGVRWTTEFGQ